MEEDIIKLQKANKTNFEVLDKEKEIFSIIKSDENNDFILINSSLIRKSSVQSIYIREYVKDKLIVEKYHCNIEMKMKEGNTFIILDSSDYSKNDYQQNDIYRKVRNILTETIKKFLLNEEIYLKHYKI